MNIKNTVIYVVVLATFLSSCGKSVDIEGDVFLVKGDGTPQPSAAAEVILVAAESLESVLIDSYISTVAEEMLKHEQAFKQLCSASSITTLDKISGLEKKFSDAQTSGIQNQTTDQDGTCTTLQENFLKSEEASAGYKLRVKELIENEESKIKAAKSEISKLQSKLKEKIYIRTKELYEDFSRDISITMSGFTLKIVNNSGYNITLNQDMCLQYKNVLGQDVGHSDGGDYGSLSTCARDGGQKDYPDYIGSGTIIKKSRIEGVGRSDQYGFNFGRYLESGASRTISGSTKYTYGQNYRDFYFCEMGSYSPSEKLKMSKQFGDDQKNWPKNLHLPDPTKGYKVKKVAAKDRFRLCISRSSKNISAQIIDDIKNITLMSASSVEKDIKSGSKVNKTELSKIVAEKLAKKAQEKKITKIFFDRGVYKYHGRVKVFAETLRKNGMDF